jgi:hypothetical protein
MKASVIAYNYVKSTAYNARTTAYNCKSTAYNGESTAYNAGTTAYNGESTENTAVYTIMLKAPNKMLFDHFKPAMALMRQIENFDFDPQNKIRICCLARSLQARSLRQQ